jgi:hypothetical protein
VRSWAERGDTEEWIHMCTNGREGERERATRRRHIGRTNVEGSGMNQTEITRTGEGRYCGGETAGQMRRWHTDMDKKNDTRRAGRSGVIQQDLFYMYIYIYGRERERMRERERERDERAKQRQDDFGKQRNDAEGDHEDRQGAILWRAGAETDMLTI